MKGFEDAFVQLEALLEGAALLLETGNANAAQGVLYTALDVVRDVVSYYPGKANTEK